MNSDNRPAKPNPENRGNGTNHNRGRKKPYYMKKKNNHSPKEEGAEQVKLEVKEAEAQSPVQAEEKPHRDNDRPGRDDFRNRRNRGNRGRGYHGEPKNPEGEERRAENEQAEVEKVEAIAFSESDLDSATTVAVAEADGVPACEGANMSPTVTVTIETEEIKYVNVTGVRFKSGGKVYYFDRCECTPKKGDHVIVETARGMEFGEVTVVDMPVKETSLVLPLRTVVRVATEEDVEHNKENKRREEEAFSICLEKIAKHGLDMKLIDAQFSFDNSKLLFYFTSASRVDFRELVKDLASVFKTRIELRQIGIRDEAKIMGGLGVCGRPLCCSTFLSDFVQVSIKMAKEQNLSLNSGKISGCCGRLMCCLQYEYKTYAEEAAKTPPVESVVKTRDGVGVVTETNPLAATVKVKLKDKPDSPPVLFNRDDVTIISRAKKDDEDK